MKNEDCEISVEKGYVSRNRGCRNCKYSRMIPDSNFGYCDNPERKRTSNRLWPGEVRVHYRYYCEFFAWVRPGSVVEMPRSGRPF